MSRVVGLFWCLTIRRTPGSVLIAMDVHRIPRVELLSPVDNGMSMDFRFNVETTNALKQVLSLWVRSLRQALSLGHNPCRTGALEALRIDAAPRHSIRSGILKALNIEVRPHHSMNCREANLRTDMLGY